MRKKERGFLRKFLLGVLLFAITGHSYAQTGATFKQWADETLAQIDTDFRIPGSNLYYDNLNHSHATAWPLGVQLNALIAGGKIAQAEACVNELNPRYWCNYNGIWGYNAVYNSCGDRYYDDNAWLAIALMELYSATNNTNYLNRAKEVTAFCMSGEVTTGGISWHEGDPKAYSLIGTIPTALACLMIYRATNETLYRTDGTRLYAFVKSQGWGIGSGYRGYENAVECQTAILLYKITGDATYLTDAIQLGLSMETAYVDYASHALHETGHWGGHDMTNAYVALYQLNGDVNWLNIAAGYLKFLHDNLKNSSGRYPIDWGGDIPGGEQELILQACVARAYAKMGSTPGGRAKYADPVAVFKDCNYAGSWDAGLWIGRYTKADLAFLDIRDNDLSSVRVQPGYQVTLYDGDTFTGDSLVLTADNSCIGMNDRVSSLIVKAVSPTVMVYKDCHYTGRTINLPAGAYTLAQLQARGINDNDISSIKVAAGHQIQFYEHDNFTGATVTLTADNNCLVDTGWNDRITSLKISSTNCTPTAITPHVQLNGGAWQDITCINAVQGNNLILGPGPEGTWSWTGPNGFMSANREVILNNIQSGNEGSYVGTLVNSSGCISQVTFNIGVITPALQINNGSWQFASSASITVGSGIRFGPGPGNGTWSWTGPNSFTANTREATLANVQPNRAGNYVATYTSPVGCTGSITFSLAVSNGCTPSAITPHVRVNGGSWQNTSSVSVGVGANVLLGPGPTGTWSWTGPNGFTAGTREVAFNNIQANQAGDYLGIYTNSSGCVSTVLFTISITSPAMRVTSTSALGEASSFEGVSYYPNPVSDQLTVHSVPANTTIVVSDLFGRRLLAVRSLNEKGDVKIDMGGFSDGIYLVRVGRAGAVRISKQ